ncbi:MAG: LuxR C-terminal-related transcriptional regulator [Sedimentisphaerales bacterium]
MKSEAVDFIEKPLDKQTSIKNVKSTLLGGALSEPDLSRRLTRAETHVLELVLDGYSSEEVPRRLRCSRRTSEVDRTKLMRKLDVENLLDRAKRAASM